VEYSLLLFQGLLVGLVLLDDGEVLVFEISQGFLGEGFELVFIVLHLVEFGLTFHQKRFHVLQSVGFKSQLRATERVERRGNWSEGKHLLLHFFDLVVADSRALSSLVVVD
jgi:hypothetical protein